MSDPDVTADGRGCPSDDDLAAFVEHSAELPLRARIEDHLDGCADCREAVGHIASAVASEPRTIDRYRLDAKLGEGGMGQVFRAWDPALERAIAIKLLHPELHDDHGRDRAKREAKVLARLQHPNVVAIHDVGEHDGDVFIATELVDGESMDRWQRDRSPREIVAAYAQAARGLAAAHALGLVHRDIKPSNILVSRDGRVRVGDFGLATNAARSSVMRKPPETPASPLPMLTASGQVVGTPAYMAPEQRESTQVDARADQYSLCLALAEALLGKFPPEPATVERLAASGIDAPWAAIARGLELDPGDRFPHIDELVAALEATPRPARRLGLIIPAAAAVLAALVGVGAWAMRRDTRTAPPPIAPSESAWTWTARSSGPWQLPFRPVDVILDKTHALVLGPAIVAAVDLATGAVTTAPVLGDGTSVDAFVRLGERVLIVGSSTGAAAAWQVTTSPLAVTTVAIPDAPAPVGDGSYYSDAIVSPDGAHVLVCTAGRDPTLRTAASLAVVRAFPGASCFSAHFTDAGHVSFRDVTEPRLLDLATGAITTPPEGEPDRWLGPRDLRVEVADSMAWITDGTRSVNRLPVRGSIETLAWTRTNAVVLVGDTLTIAPLVGDGSVRTVELPELMPQIATNDTLAVAISGRSLLRIDLASGRMQKPPHNLSWITDVAPRGGSVIAKSDRVRVWRNGKLVGATSSAFEIAVGGPTSPVALASLETIELWDPDTDEREPFHSLVGISMQLGRDGDTLYATEGSTLLRGTVTTALKRWQELRDDVSLVGVDVRRDRIALDARGATHIVDVAARTIWSWWLPSAADGTCEPARHVRFSPDGTTLGIDRGIQLIDSAKRLLFELETGETWVDWTFLPTGEVIAVDAKRVTIVDPYSLGGVSWATPIDERPKAIGVSPDGTELAVGYDDGSVLWANITELRKRAKPASVIRTTKSLCAPPPPAVAYDALLAD